MLNARAKITLDAKPEAVWAVVTDYAGYARFPGITAATLREPGGTHPCGVGAIREVKAGAATFVEEIVEFEVPRRLVYKIIEDHRQDKRPIARWPAAVKGASWLTDRPDFGSKTLRQALPRLISHRAAAPRAMGRGLGSPAGSNCTALGSTLPWRSAIARR